MGLQFADGPSSVLSREFAQVHPDLKSMVMEFAHWSDAERLPEATVTDVFRGKTKNGDAYVKMFKRNRLQLLTSGHIVNTAVQIQAFERREMSHLLGRLGNNGLRDRVLGGDNLTNEERTEVDQVLTDTVIERESRDRFTWHLVFCAVDLRCFHYSPEQEHSALAWLQKHCLPVTRWECLKDGVIAPCFHIAVKDTDWAKRHGPDEGGVA